MTCHLKPFLGLVAGFGGGAIGFLFAPEAEGIILILLDSLRVVTDLRREFSSDSRPPGPIDDLPLSRIDVCLLAPPLAAVSH